MAEENPQPTQSEDAQQAIWNLPVESEERRKFAETAQGHPAQPVDGQSAAETPFAGDPVEQAIWNLPVESEERRKLAESAQSLRFQHDAPEAEAE